MPDGGEPMLRQDFRENRFHILKEFLAQLAEHRFEFEFVTPVHKQFL
jgi:hypothetical protein